MAAVAPHDPVTRDRAHLLGIAGLFALAVATAATLALHRIRSDLDLVATPLSFYSHGRGGWLLGVSLVSSGIAALLTAAAVMGRTGRRAGIALLVVTGFGLIGAATWLADPWFPWERGLTTRGWAHAVCVGVAVVTFPSAGLLLSRDAGLVQGEPLAPRILWALTLAYIIVLGGAGVITMVFIATGRDPAFLGLVERLLLVLGAAWLVIVAPVPKAVVGGG